MWGGGRGGGARGPAVCAVQGGGSAEPSRREECLVSPAAPHLPDRGTREQPVLSNAIHPVVERDVVEGAHGAQGTALVASVPVPRRAFTLTPKG